MSQTFDQETIFSIVASYEAMLSEVSVRSVVSSLIMCTSVSVGESTVSPSDNAHRTAGDTGCILLLPAEEEEDLLAKGASDATTHSLIDTDTVD